MDAQMPEEKNKKPLYELYRVLNESDIPLFKKKAMLRSLFIGESWTWVVTKISLAALAQFEKHEYEKKPHIYDRHHPKPFKKTAEEMLVEPTLSYKKWCKIIKENEIVHLLTKAEHRKCNKEQPSMIPISEKGLFCNGGKTVGYSYGDKEKDYLKRLAKKHLS